MKVCLPFFSFIIISLMMVQPLLALDEEMEIKVILVPYRESIISSKIDSTIQEYKVKEGAAIKKGQLLVIMDDKYYTQLYNNSQAALKEAKTRTSFSEEDYKMKVQLYQRGVYGSMDLKESKYNSDLAKSQREQANAKHFLNKYNLNSCKVYAPFDGRVVKKIARIYEYIKTGDPVLKVINDKKLYAVIHLPSTEITSIKPDDKLAIFISETGKRYEVKIEEISADIDPRSRTFEVKAVIDNSEGKLRAGMSGYLDKK